MIARLLRLSFLAASLPLVLTAAPREETNLNAGWRFHYGEAKGAETAAFNDSTWSKVDVPHTWNAQDGQDGVKDGTATAPGPDTSTGVLCSSGCTGAMTAMPTNCARSPMMAAA